MPGGGLNAIHFRVCTLDNEAEHSVYRFMAGALTPLLLVRIGRAIRQVRRMAIEGVPEQILWNDRLMADLRLSVLIPYHVIPVFHPSNVHRITEHTAQSCP